MKPGYVQLYTGENKGKTTAATGLALRMLGHGKRVLFVQFMKSVPSGEVTMLQQCDKERVRVLRRWDESFVLVRPSRKQVAMAQALWEEMKKETARFHPDLLVLDEVVVAIGCGLLEESEVLCFLTSRPPELEVVLTGRGASATLMAACDLVTEMCKIRHYYDAGVPARKGIEY